MNRRTVPNYDKFQFRHISEVLPTVLAHYAIRERPTGSKKRTNRQLTLFDDLMLAISPTEQRTAIRG